MQYNTSFYSVVVPCTQLKVGITRFFFLYIRKAPYNAYPANTHISLRRDISLTDVTADIRRPRVHRAPNGLLHEVVSRHSYIGCLLSEISIAIASYAQ